MTPWLHIASHKIFNIPYIHVFLPSLTRKDSYILSSQGVPPFIILAAVYLGSRAIYLFPSEVVFVVQIYALSNRFSFSLLLYHLHISHITHHYAFVTLPR